MRNSSGKMTPGARGLFWLIALVFILACALPSAATPVALPIDPNAVNLFIAQTAGAASTQTAAALPTLSITPTFTSTPRNTFTPEPTFTPFQTFVLPSPRPAQQVQYFRVKHDNQLAIYDYKSRTAGPDWPLNPQTPETVPLFVDPKEGTGTWRTKVDGAWEPYFEALNNNNERKLRYLKASASGLFNGAGFPQMESLTMGGNIVTLDAIQDGWGRLHTMDYSNPGSAASENYTTRPDLVHKFVVVVWSRRTKSTYWVNPPHGAIYWPFVASRPVWVQMERLEPFPILPMTVTVNESQDIRRSPQTDGELTGKELSVNDSVVIVEYYPSGPNVWGRLQSGGWISLILDEEGVPNYPTTWSMETQPPPGN
ncbi:MAG TPA: hypothetical protein VJ022_07090 [Anaerolineales bacterium]|nr:hypothetical protein [Anaerolineales bacterium]